MYSLKSFTNGRANSHVKIPVFLRSMPLTSGSMVLIATQAGNAFFHYGCLNKETIPLVLGWWGGRGVETLYELLLMRPLSVTAPFFK